MTSENRTITYKVGDIIGSDYCLLEKLGEGGMGMVFRAKHMIMESIYALKILRPEQITTATWMRFQAEAKALSKLSHPNVVQIYNMGIDRAGVPFYVMELLSGRSLADEIAAKGPLSLKRAAEIFLPVCSALAFSHKHGIIHRDIKPSNMMLVESHQNTPTVKLVDFGIAKTQHLTGFEGQSLTTTGEIFGTPYYLSPECISGKSADARSDIYSLGCAIFETLTGAPPFQGKSMLHTLMMHQNVSAPTLKSVNPNGVYSQEVEVFVARLLAKDPDDRFQNIDAVAERLNQLCVSDGAQGQGGGNTTTNRQPRAPEEDFSTTTIVTGTNSPWRRNLIIATVLLLT
ncbi:MAG: serine/threonine protein kinase, partial [Cyanobacteria bacterium SZAS LIN-2]|nr:serine/threonine protein kinase [Cyanobacteria bacterium SZAS LIN-2]